MKRNYNTAISRLAAQLERIHDDPGLADFVRRLEAAKAGVVKAINVEIFNDDATKATEIDVVTATVLIQYKAGTGGIASRIVRQVAKTKAVTDREVIVFGERITAGNSQRLRKHGVTVIRDFAELLKRL